MANEKRLIDGNGRYTLHAADNTDYSLLFRNGIICVENELGHCVCEFHADDAPTVDAAPVVRCKQCKHIRPEVDAYTHEVVGHYCSLLDIGDMKDEDFCSYGERRNDG